MKSYMKRTTAALLVFMLASGAVVKDTDNIFIEGKSCCAAVYAAEMTASSAGWKESAYTEWLPADGAARYEAYVKEAGAQDYTKLDDMLIRQYPTYCRADAIGLKAGKYLMKISAFDDKGAEISSFESPVIDVKAYNRNGFAFSSDSYEKGTGLGGYKADGTPKDNAQIIYITDENKNTVTYDIVTDSKGNTTKGTGLGKIMKLFEKGYEKRPFIIRFVGEVAPPYSTERFPYDITDAQLHDGSSESYRILDIKDNMKNVDEGGITFEGIGADTILHFNLNFARAKSIEVRNLGFKDMTTKDEDGITVTSNSTNVWIHNCDFFYGGKGSDKDQAKGDGSIDIKYSPDYCLVNENHFWDNGKSILCGPADKTDYRITFALNWFDHSDSRHPRISGGSVHIYNNYFDGVSKYGVGMTSGGSAFAEGNYFRNVSAPMIISKQGTEGNGSGTLSGDPGGIIKAYDNIMVGTYRYLDGVKKETNGTKSYKTWADGYSVDTRDEQLPDSLVAVSGGTSYNNFDTKEDLGVKTQDILAAADVPGYVVKNAGRCDGGNFIYKFDNAADDTDSEVNAGLNASLAAYRNNIIAFGGTVKVQSDTTAAPTSVTGVDGNDAYGIRDAYYENMVKALPKQTDPAGNNAAEAPAAGVDIPDNAVIIKNGVPVVSCDPSTTEVSDANCVVYNESSSDYSVVDKSSASTVWDIPFEPQTSGVVYIKGRLMIGEGSGKWNLFRVNGKLKDGTSSQIVSFASNANRESSIWVKGEDTGLIFGDMVRNKKYTYTFMIDFDNQKAELDINGKTQTVDIDVSEISSVRYITPKTKTISITSATLPVVYTLNTAAEDAVLGDWDGDKAVTASDASYILQYVLSPKSMNASDEQINRCKVLGDPSLTASDAAAVLQKALNENYPFPAEKK